MLEVVWETEIVEVDSPAEAMFRSSNCASKEESTLADDARFPQQIGACKLPARIFPAQTSTSHPAAGPLIALLLLD